VSNAVRTYYVSRRSLPRSSSCMAISNRQLFEIHRSKISLHRAKADYSYPTIRLPRTFSTLAGLPTRIIKRCMTEHLHFWSSCHLQVYQETLPSDLETTVQAPKPPSSHGGGRRFESGRAHLLLADQDPLHSFSISELSTQLSTPRQTTVTQSLATLALDFELDELCSYTEARSIGLARKSVDWIKRSSTAFWRATRGTVKKQSIDRLRSYTLERYQSTWSRSKTLAFAKAFLGYLTKTRLDYSLSGFQHIPRLT
jgi:hypothetical protein